MSDESRRSCTPEVLLYDVDGGTPRLPMSASEKIKYSSSTKQRKRISRKRAKSKKSKTKKPVKKSSRKRRHSSTSSSSSTSSTDDDSIKNKSKKSRFSHRMGVVNPFINGEDKMIPVFDPQNADQSVELWVRRVDELAKFYNWDNLMIIKLVANRLVGMARRWYDSQDQLAVEWGNMKPLLIKQFAKPLPFAKLLREAALYETYGGQNLSEYCFTKLDKLKALHLNIPESSLIDAVIGGITDENIARSARSSRFKDTNELYAYLSTL